MSQVALRISTPSLVVLEGGHSQTKAKLAGYFSAPSREMYVLGALMIFLQIMDGVLTGVGVSYLGVSAEGNLLLRSMMEQIGYIPALVIVKCIAVGVVATLCVLSTHVNWVRRAMKLMILVYLTVAVLPWTAILITRLS